MGDSVNYPDHYGGADNPYEAIKVIEAWGLGFNLGNAVKYIARATKKGALVEDLRKAAWYAAREVFLVTGDRMLREPVGEVPAARDLLALRSEAVRHMGVLADVVERWISSEVRDPAVEAAIDFARKA